MRSALLLNTLLSFSTHAADTYAPAAVADIPREVYWGDTHVHSVLSADSYQNGSRLTAADAYRFAMGDATTLPGGRTVRLRRPLDFLVVTDHAEYLGVFARLDVDDPETLATSLGARWAGYLADIENQQNLFLKEYIGSVLRPEQAEDIPLSLKRSIWHQVTATADRYNQPGRFTAFAGYEFSPAPNMNGLHRNVVFKDDASKTNQTVPFSTLDSANPEDLWVALAAYETTTGGEVLAIPHNANLSNGLMFATTNYAGQPIDNAYAAARARWEPLVEVTQVKGDGEAHPFLSPDDEFADFDTWDRGNMMGAKKKPEMLQHEYARSALKLGLQIEAKVGMNPYRFGLIGSTDVHTALPAVEEDNFLGKFPASNPAPERIAGNIGPGGSVLGWANWTLAAGGYVGVWAHENTRESLFRAMRRKEVYATTGPRLRVRFFGGWQFRTGDTERADFITYAYANGVPMGGELMAAAAATAPTFLVVALKDPDGANLDRVQIVKGWLDAAGITHEQVYDVALSDRRNIKPGRRAKPVGSTVDIETATYRNSIGAVQLSAVWQDPMFDPAHRAFYYVRVLEIPTPRWTAIDAAKFGLELDQKIPVVHQERAYTSPIWYGP